MFSSFVKSIRSIAKGPRAVLAENIAQVLSEHFVLDPADIESSLLIDSRIVLRNTQLRKKRYRSCNVPNTVMSVGGCVEEVVFSWRWSFTGSASASGSPGPSSSAGGMVQDVVLAIRGVKARIRLDALDTEEQSLVENFESASISDDSEMTDRTSLKEKESFLQTYVQQIFDNLTLKLGDFDFTIQAGNGPSVVIAGKDLELGTLSSASASGENDVSKTMLTQKISIGSFFANLRDGESGKSFPLIEPFGYAASIIRFSGVRFKGGILSGLEIVGLPEAQNGIVNDQDDRTDEGVLFHIGLPQIQMLSVLGMMLVPSSSSSTNYVPSEELTGHDTTEGGESSTFNLPLPALTIVLPASGVDRVPTKITLPRATVLYRANGQVFQIEGREGIKDNGTSLVTLATGGKWSVDFVKKIFDLDKDGEGCKIQVSDEALRRISSSVILISSTDHIASLKDAWEDTKDAPADQIDEVAPKTWSILTGNANLQLTGGENWFEANVAYSHLRLVPEMNKLAIARVGKCTVKSSFDKATLIIVPPFKLVSEMLHVSDRIETAVSSIENALRVRDFLFSFLEPETAHASNEIRDLPCTIQVDELRLVVRESDMTVSLKRMRGEGTSFSCESALYTAGELKVESQNIHMHYQTSDVHIKIGSVLSLVIPEVFLLSQPIVDTSIVYKSKGILVDADKIHGMFERPKIQQTKIDTKKSKSSIPVPIQLDLKLLTLKEAGTSTLIGIKQIFISVNQSGSAFFVESREGMKMRLQQSPKLFIDATMGKLSLQLQEDNGHLKARNISLMGAKLGPCSPSYGILLIVIPPVSKEDGQKLLFHEGIDVSFDSIEVFDKLHPLFDSIVGPQEGDPFHSFPFPLEVPEIKISASNPPSTIQIGETFAIRSNIRCQRVNASVQNSISLSMKGLEGDIMSRSLNVDCVESLQLAGTMELLKQFNNMNLKLEREDLYVNIPTPIHAKIISKSSGVVPSQTVSPTQHNVKNIPFQVHVRVSEANLKTLRKGDKRCIEMKGIVLDVLPTMIPSQDLLSGERKEGVNISLGMENIEHDMFQVQNVETSLMVELQGLKSLHQVQLSIHSSRIEAGYSKTEWSSLVKEAGPNDGLKQQVLRMPFAKVARTSMLISYQGSVVDSNATVSIPEFTGNSFTTSDDLSKYFINTVVGRIPGFLTNVNILGTNVVDSSFATVGRFALGASSMATAGVGSVVGTAAADGVKAAIAAGKTGRNVTTDDSYKFGDISRGLFKGLKHATKKGAQSRGSDGSDYVPGDFTVGAAQSLGIYGERNSKKLASAGASGAAATVGLAVAGPLGFVVGGYLGGKFVGGEKAEQQLPPQQQLQQQKSQNAPPEAAFNHFEQYKAQDFTRILQHEQQRRRNQEEIPMANAPFQQHEQEIPMVSVQVISDHTEPVMNIFNNDVQQGNQRQRNCSKNQKYQQARSRQNYPQSFSNQGNQSSQFQQPQVRRNQQYQTQSGQYQQSQAPQNQQYQSQYLTGGQQTQSSQYQQSQAPQNQQYQSQYLLSGQQQQKEQYKFGDVTRGILAKGKQSDGRSKDSGYKFGKSIPEKPTSVGTIGFNGSFMNFITALSSL